MSPSHVYWAILNSIWQSGALALLVALAVRTIRGLTAAQRHVLWFSVLIAAAILPFADVAMPARSIPVSMHAFDVPAASRVARVTVTPATRVLLTSHRVSARAAHANATLLAVPDASSIWRSRLPTLPLYVWAAISFALLIRLGLGYARLRAAKSSLLISAQLSRSAGALISQARSPSFVGLSTTLGEPCVIGFVHPVIAIPVSMASTLPQTDLERILRHECAHIARGDDYANLVRQLVRAVFFFNPVVHYASQAVAVECEIACDDAAAAAERDRIAFAKCLYEIARGTKRRAYSPAAGFVGSRRQIVLRVARLLERNHRASAGLGLAARSAAVAVLVAGIALGGVRLSAAAVAAQSPIHNSTASGELTVFVNRAIQPLSAAAAEPWNATQSAVSVVTVKANVGSVPTVEAPKSSLHDRVHAHLHVADASSAQSDDPQDSNGDLVDALNRAGYRGVSVDDLIELANHGVTGAFVSQLKSYGIGPMPPSSLIEMADHGVTAQYLAGMRDAGYTSLNVDDLVRLQDHGVSLNFAQGLNKALRRRLSVEDLRRMADSGVTVDFVSRMAQLGYENVPAEDFIQMANAGVTSDFVARIVHSGMAGSHPSVEDLIRLRNSGI